MKRGKNTPLFLGHTIRGNSNHTWAFTIQVEEIRGRALKKQTIYGLWRNPSIKLLPQQQQQQQYPLPSLHDLLPAQGRRQKHHGALTEALDVVLKRAGNLNLEGQAQLRKLGILSKGARVIIMRTNNARGRVNSDIACSREGVYFLVLCTIQKALPPSTFLRRRRRESAPRRRRSRCSTRSSIRRCRRRGRSGPSSRRQTLRGGETGFQTKTEFYLIR